ncbi:MAG: hypothetical protein U0Q22_00080 [Acidimicrobiales bacterium]
MTTDDIEALVRRAIGGDESAVANIIRSADTTSSAIVCAMAALLQRLPGGLDRADGLAATSRDRQVVTIARAALAGDRDRVDALARDHLADHPDSLIVSWLASPDR